MSKSLVMKITLSPQTNTLPFVAATKEFEVPAAASEVFHGTGINVGAPTMDGREEVSGNGELFVPNPQSSSLSETKSEWKKLPDE